VPRIRHRPASQCAGGRFRFESLPFILNVLIGLRAQRRPHEHAFLAFSVLARGVHFGMLKVVNHMAQMIVTRTRPAYQAYQLLYLGFIIAPLVAGLDKFTHFLTDWDKYLAPAVAGVLPFSTTTFMLFVGIVEIGAAALVAFRPQIGAYVVAAWLAGIVINLLLIPGYLDIALRDFGLMLGALALARLSEEFPEGAA